MSDIIFYTILISNIIVFLCGTLFGGACSAKKEFEYRKRIRRLEKQYDFERRMQELRDRYDLSI